MNVREAAEYLTSRGYTCAVPTVRALVKAGKLTCFRPGVSKRGPLSFTAAQLDALLGREEVRPATGPADAPAPPATAPGKAARTPKVAKPKAGSDWRERMAAVKGA